MTTARGLAPGRIGAARRFSSIRVISELAHALSNGAASGWKEVKTHGRDEPVSLSDHVRGLTRAHGVISKGKPCVTSAIKTHASAWLENPEVKLFNQMRLGKEGFAVTLLWASLPEDDEPEETPEELGKMRFP